MNRFEDEILYNNKDYLLKPKEIHKKVFDLISSFSGLNKFKSILDVGCANGNFLHYLKSNIAPSHQIELFGVDIHQNLLDIAKKQLPDCRFFCTSVNDLSNKVGEFELITCLGVMSIFDNFSEPLHKMYNILHPGGKLIITTEFNNHPIDVIVRYRNALNDNDFQNGWNIFSKVSVEKAVSDLQGANLEWIDFKMPFSIKKTYDPMRAWTIQTEDNPFQQVNGAQQLINQSILVVEKKIKD